MALALTFPAALAAATSTPALKFIAISALSQIAGNVGVHTTVAKLLGSEREMETNKIFRSTQDPMMIYPLVSPFVSSFLSLLIAYAFFGPAAVAAWSLEQALSYTLGIWLVGAFHGIFLDYSVINMPFTIAILWWAGSLTTAAINGWVMHAAL